MNRKPTCVIAICVLNVLCAMCVSEPFLHAAAFVQALTHCHSLIAISFVVALKKGKALQKGRATTWMMMNLTLVVMEMNLKIKKIQKWKPLWRSHHQQVVTTQASNLSGGAPLSINK